MIRHFNILYFLYKSKSKTDGTIPIYCRITLNGNRKQFTTTYSTTEKAWNNKTQRIKGASPEARFINNNLQKIENDLLEIVSLLGKKGSSVMIEDIYNKFIGADTDKKTLMEVFEYHNQKMKALIGKEYSGRTYQKFVAIQNNIQEFIKQQFNKSDIGLAELKISFLEELDFYFKTVKHHNQNTINKTIERVKKVVKIALGNGWIKTDPFLLYRKKKHIKEVVFLEKAELKRFENFNFAQKRLEHVKDCFIFSCYTGLAYNEASILTNEHLIKREDGFIWIEISRQKTGRPLFIPLLPKAIEILKKYGFPNKEGQLLPLISNQRFNSYLKEVAEVVGINKHLTHHIARKTFTSTVLMGNDVPIEIASYLLGHSKTSTTEMHYGKVVRDKVSEHMSNLVIRLKNK